jgi:hypothetical protein
MTPKIKWSTSSTNGMRRTLLPVQVADCQLGRHRPRVFYDWRTEYWKANECNSCILRDHWTDAWKRNDIVQFAREFPLSALLRKLLPAWEHNSSV